MTDAPLRVVTAGDLPMSFPQSAFAGRATFEAARTDEELKAAVRSADVLYSWQVPEDVPSETPSLRWIQLPSAGVDHVRHLPLWKSDVLLTASKGIHAVPMSEHFFALLLALTRQLPSMIRAQDRQEWNPERRSSAHRLGELRGKTLGIVGWGKIGDGVAHLARAFGMRVIGTRWSIVVPREEPRNDAGPLVDEPWVEDIQSGADVVYPAAQLHEVLSASDVVLLLLPLTHETEGSFGAEHFAAMKRGSLFFNMGRGSVVDTEALVHALMSGHLAGAGLDVFDPEPLPRSSPLWSIHNVIVSPHVGGVSTQTRERAARFFAVNLTRYLEGQPLLNQIDRTHEY